MIKLIIIIIVLFFVFLRKKKPINKVTTYPKTNTSEKSGIASQKVVPQSSFKKETIATLVKSNSNAIINDSSSIEVSSKATNIPPSDNLAITNKATDTKNRLISELVNSVQKNASNRIEKDDSIIDITGNESTLITNEDNIIERYKKEIPYWAHIYIYSYSEINTATEEQRLFYEFFRKSFLSGEYLDLQGNTNYAFILLFDLLQDYDMKHRDIEKLKSQLKYLGEKYPKTYIYIDFNLRKRTPHISNFEKTSSPNNGATTSTNTQNNYPDYDYWKLGSKYKTKLSLNEEQVKLLNNLWYPSNNFCSIEFCLLEILKLYIITISRLKDKYKTEGTDLDTQFLTVADFIARKHFHFHKPTTDNYKSCIKLTVTEFYTNIFKHCENAVREKYGHKRKVNTETTYYTTPAAKQEYHYKILNKINEILVISILEIALPDEETEILLFSRYANRWRIRFDEIAGNYNGNPKEFINSIISLANLNKKNPYIPYQNIFFEASKFISKHNKESTLSLYIYYLYYGFTSLIFEQKKLPKSIQKAIFKTEEQLHDFELIVSGLSKDRNLENALKAVSEIYTIKRKKITLDIAAIKEVQEQHSGTVELLSEFLKDDDENETNIRQDLIKPNEISNEITQTKSAIQNTVYTVDIRFTDLQIQVLELFSKNNLSVSQTEISIFAKSNGVFSNQLIENINDVCYDYLDDVLIEEEDDYYLININYYEKLLSK